MKQNCIYETITIDIANLAKMNETGFSKIYCKAECIRIAEEIKNVDYENLSKHISESNLNKKQISKTLQEISLFSEDKKIDKLVKNIS